MISLKDKILSRQSYPESWHHYYDSWMELIPSNFKYGPWYKFNRLHKYNIQSIITLTMPSRPIRLSIIEQIDDDLEEEKRIKAAKIKWQLDHGLWTDNLPD